MGNACECEGTNENEVLHGVVRPPPDDVVQAVGAAAAMKEKAYDLNVAPEIVKLRGTWKTENDGQTMGKIEGGEIFWDSLFNHSRTFCSSSDHSRGRRSRLGQPLQLLPEPVALGWPSPHRDGVDGSGAPGRGGGERRAQTRLERWRDLGAAAILDRDIVSWGRALCSAPALL
mmetsp:Transcript_119495/g.381289  ORF Transcript_119495/g.381289 Transcript_119495/m.381289 type:complete len:173 (+) Transcript_119495:135-653(+)